MIPPFCAEPEDPCCDCLYEVTAALVDAATTAVLECLPEDLCEGFVGYVALSRPHDLGDFVAGWFDGPTVLPSQQSTPGAKQLIAPRLGGNITIRLVESGFPTISLVGGRIALPDRDRLNHTSRHFMGHAEKVTRALINQLRPACTTGCDTIQLVRSTPQRPEGAWMAWEWTLLTTLRW